MDPKVIDSIGALGNPNLPNEEGPRLRHYSSYDLHVWASFFSTAFLRGATKVTMTHLRASYDRGYRREARCDGMLIEYSNAPPQALGNWKVQSAYRDEDHARRVCIYDQSRGDVAKYLVVLSSKSHNTIAGIETLNVEDINFVRCVCVNPDHKVEIFSFDDVGICSFRKTV